jgi:peptide/nickel transport system permease protein
VGVDAKQRRSAPGAVQIILPKLVRLVVVVVFLVTATFFMLELAPGDAAIAALGPNASPSQLTAARAELGLDQPLLTRYFSWVGSTLRGDFGRSLVPPNQGVVSLIRFRIPVTLEIAVLAGFLALLIAIPVAMRAAQTPGSRFDRITTGFASASVSIPSFVMALILIYFLVFNEDAVRLAFLGLALGGIAVGAYRVVRLSLQRPRTEVHTRLVLRRIVLLVLCFAGALVLFVAWPSLPRQGFSRLTSSDGLVENLRHAFLPALCLALAQAAVFTRVLRRELVVTLNQDYILAARAKGMPKSHVLWREALRPSAPALVAVAGVTIGQLLGGTLIIESIFNLPGLGSLIVESVQAKDVRVVQACAVVIGVLYVLLNVLVDGINSYLDPRIRRGGG